MTTLMPPVQDTCHPGLGPSTRRDATASGDVLQHRPVAGWQIDRKATPESRTEKADPAVNAAVDVMALLGRCLGNFELIVRVLARFRMTGGTDLEQLGHAIERSDFAAVVEIAHRFKGAAGNISAGGLHRIAAGMEQFGQENNAAGLPGLLSQLRTEWQEFLKFADAFAPPGAASQVQPVK